MNKVEFKEIIKHEGLALLRSFCNDIEEAFNDEENDPLNLNELVDKIDDGNTELSIDLAVSYATLIVAQFFEPLISTILEILKPNK